jgi:signal transduction histidine kinase
MSALDALADATLVVDGDRRIVDANAAAVELSGRAREELVGAPCADALRPRARDGTPLLAAGWPRASAMRSVRGMPEHDVTIRTAHGDLLVRVTGRYHRDHNGDVDGAVLSLRRAARPSDGPSGVEVVSTVSHELRSPLTSVKGYTSLLLHRWDRLTDEQKLMMLGRVHHDADRVTRLISELLDISRIEIGTLSLRRQMVDVCSLATMVVEKLTLEYPDLECEVDAGADLPEVYADPDKVEQVLTNLVENAAKYASPSGMRIVAARLDDAVAVSVHDRGEGIPAADLPHVFRKFYRRDHGRPSGTGLGLWISRGLVEAHGGRLVAESVQGDGSTFTFVLPLGDVDAELLGRGGAN